MKYTITVIVIIIILAILTSLLHIEGSTIQNDNQVNFITGGYYLSDGGFIAADTNKDGYVILWMVGDKLILTTDNKEG